MSDEPLKVHPAADVFPMACEQVIEEIADDMRKNGYDITKPITLYRGMLLDGRNRLRAAAMAGVEPAFTELPDEADPFEESKRANLHRRGDLSPGQRSAILLKLIAGSSAWRAEKERRKADANAKRSEKAAARPRQADGTFEGASSCPSPEGRPDKHANETAAALAKEAGVSRPTMERALRLQRDNPAKFEEMRLGIKPRQVTHEERVQIIRDLFEKGTHRSEIAKRAGVVESTVSQILSDLGLSHSSPSVKLTADLKRFAASIHGLTRPAKDLTVELSGDVILDREEMRKCQNNIVEAIKAARALSKSISGRL